MIFRPCRDEEAIKPWSASFLSPWRISLLEELLLHAEQDSVAAAAQRWQRGPPEQTQRGTRQPRRTSPVKFMTLLPYFPTLRPLFRASGSTQWTLFCHIWLARLSLLFLPHIPILLLNLHLSSSMSRFGISFSHHSQTTCPAAHPDRVSTAVQVILHCISRATCRCYFASGSFLSHRRSTLQLNAIWKSLVRTNWMWFCS